MFFGGYAEPGFIGTVERTIIIKAAFDAGGGRCLSGFQQFLGVKQALCGDVFPYRHTGGAAKQSVQLGTADIKFPTQGFNAQGLPIIGVDIIDNIGDLIFMLVLVLLHD